MGSIRQINPYRNVAHDPLWIVADGALVDGVPNGISDGSGGVAYLLGFDDASGNFVDESRNAFTDAIPANSGVKGVTSAYVLPKCFITNGTNLNADAPIVGRSQLRVTTNGTPFVTAFTFEFYVKLNTTGDPDTGFGSEIMDVNFGSDRLLFRVTGEASGTDDYNIIKNGATNLFGSGDLIARDTWHHYAIENKVPGNSPRNIDFYFDGVKVVSPSIGFGNTIPGNWLLIAIANGSGSKMVNYIDEVRLTKGAYRYGANFTPNPIIGTLGGLTQGFIRG